MIQVARAEGWEKTEIGKLTLLCQSDATDEHVLEYVRKMEVSSEDELSKIVSVIEEYRPIVQQIMLDMMK